MFSGDLQDFDVRKILWYYRGGKKFAEEGIVIMSKDMNDVFAEMVDDEEVNKPISKEEADLISFFKKMDEGERIYISDVILDIDEELKQHDNKIFLIAGVGAGKSSWVKKVLALKGNVLFVTSRRAKVDEDINDSCFENIVRFSDDEHQALITNAKLAKVIENLNLRSGDMNIDNFLNNYEYIVIDEIHSMATDSIFAKSSFGLLNFIEYAVKKKKKVICMTGTPEPVQKYFKKNGWYCRDLRKICNYVRPQKIVTIKKEEINSIIEKALDKGKKIVYFVNSTDSIKEQYDILVKEKIVAPEEISAVVAADKQNKLEKDLSDIFGDKNKKLIEISKGTYQNIIENKLLPEGCKILLSTSKLREGIDIMDKNAIVICDNHILTNIIQFCGRVRYGTEAAYIVEDAAQHPNKQEKVLYQYAKEETVAANYFLNKYIEIEESEFSRTSTKKKKGDKEKFIEHIEDNRYCRFNYIDNEFQRYQLLYKEEARIKKNLENWRKELIDYCIEYHIRPPFPYSWKVIVEDVLEKMCTEQTKLYIHTDSGKIKAITKVICRLPVKAKKEKPKTCSGLNEILKENRIPYQWSSVAGGKKKKEAETYWCVKKKDI